MVSNAFPSPGGLTKEQRGRARRSFSRRSGKFSDEAVGAVTSVIARLLATARASAAAGDEGNGQRRQLHAPPAPVQPPWHVLPSAPAMAERRPFSRAAEPPS